MSGMVVLTPENFAGLVLVLLGPPGSGKGTQALRLSQRLGIAHISTGDLFRSNIRNDTPVGRRAKEFIHQGKLVPDEVTMQMLAERVAASDCRNGCILDGVPRNGAQVAILDALLQKHGQKLVAVYLEVSNEEVIKRISGRRSCPKCGATYHLLFSPSSQEGLCDKDQTALVQREDDRPEVIQERLKIYHEQTAPIVGLYRARGLLQTVNGEQKPDLIFEQLVALLA